MTAVQVSRQSNLIVAQQPVQQVIKANLQARERIHNKRLQNKGSRARKMRRTISNDRQCCRLPKNSFCSLADMLLGCALCMMQEKRNSKL